MTPLLPPNETQEEAGVMSHLIFLYNYLHSFPLSLSLSLLFCP